MQLFTDGFESGGLGSWTEAVATGTGTSIGASGAAALAGNYGLRATHDTASDQNYEARATVLFSPSTTGRTYLEGLVRLTSVTAVGFGAVGSKAVLAIRATDGQEQLWLSLRAGGLRLGYRSKAGNAVTINSNIPVPTNVPRRFRLLVDRAGVNPSVEAWISSDNGATWTSLGTATDVSSGAAGLAKSSGRADVGVVHISNFEPGTYTIDVDDVVVADSVGATDWQTLNAAVQTVRFAFAGQVDYRGTVAIDSRLQTAQEGLKTAEVTTEAPIGVSSVTAALVDVLAHVTTEVQLTATADILAEQAVATKTEHALTTESAGNVLHEQQAAMLLKARLLGHTVQGEIETVARVVVTDAPHWTAVGTDSGSA